MKTNNAFLSGQRHFLRGEYGLSIASFNNALASGVDPAKAHLPLGLAHFKNYNFSGAIASYGHALAHDPRNEKILFLRGMALFNNEELGRALELPAEPPALKEVRRVVQIFRELRSGLTSDGKTKLKSPTSTLSTAEAMSVINSGMALAGHFGDGELKAGDFASGLLGAVVKDPVQDAMVWREYLETVVKERDGWRDLYRACRELD